MSDEERRPLLQAVNDADVVTNRKYPPSATLAASSKAKPSDSAIEDDEEEQSCTVQGDSLARRRSSAYLPPYHEESAPAAEPVTEIAIWAVIPILLLGVFVAQLDASLVVASSQKIASEFKALSDASWLITTYALGQCATQSLYGKLSDIFGRKYNLVIAYILFTIGCFLCGIGQAYWQVLAGRAISGIGGAGMTALVSVIIADMVPVRNVASWRSFVNIAATTGRSLGGPIGGWLTDTVGWRWAFFGQCPLTIIGLLLILFKFPTSDKKSQQEHETLDKKFRRVDIVGAVALALTIIFFLVALDFFTKRKPWYYIFILGILSLVFGIAFYLAESRWAREPILPLRLLTHRDALTVYLLVGFQLAAQFAFFYTVPIYFQIAVHASVSAAGLRLVPAVVGNALGSLLAGFVVLKTGRYKVLTITASVLASAGYLLALLRWHGEVHPWEISFIFLGGFGMGIIQSTIFVHLAASFEQSEIAIVGTTQYLAQNIFLLLGIQVVTAIQRAQLRKSLHTALDSVERGSEIIHRVLSNIESIWRLPISIKKIVIRSYLDSLSYAYGLSVVAAVIGLLLGLSLRERKL